MTMSFVGGAAFFTFLFVFGSLACLNENGEAFTRPVRTCTLNSGELSLTVLAPPDNFLCNLVYVPKMLALINRVPDLIRSLFWKEEMELTLAGLQNPGKITFVNVICMAHWQPFYSDVFDRMFNIEFRDSDPQKDIRLSETKFKGVEICHLQQPFTRDKTKCLSCFALRVHSEAFDRMFNAEFRESDPQEDISLLDKKLSGIKMREPFASTVRHSNLYYLEAIHNFVEVLIKYLHNVCELDLVFNFYKVLTLAWLARRRGGVVLCAILLAQHCSALCICEDDDRIASCKGSFQRGKLLLCNFDMVRIYEPTSCNVPSYLKSFKVEFVDSACEGTSIQQIAAHTPAIHQASTALPDLLKPATLSDLQASATLSELQASATLSDLQTFAAFRSTESSTPSSQPIEASQQLSAALKVVLTVFGAFLFIVCALCGCILYLMRAEVKKRNAKLARDLENGAALDNIVLDTADWQNHQRELEARLAALRRLSGPTTPPVSTASANPLASTSSLSPLVSTSSINPPVSAALTWQLVSDAAASLVASTASAKPLASSATAKPLASSATAKPSSSTKSAKPIAPFHMQLRTADERCPCLACTLPNCCPHPFTYADFNLDHGRKKSDVEYKF